MLDSRTLWPVVALAVGVAVAGGGKVIGLEYWLLYGGGTAAIGFSIWFVVVSKREGKQRKAEAARRDVDHARQAADRMETCQRCGQRSDRSEMVDIGSKGGQFGPVTAYVHRKCPEKPMGKEDSNDASKSTTTGS